MKLNEIFQIDIKENTEIFLSGFLQVKYRNIKNLSILLNKNLYNWFSKEKDEICKSFNFDPKFSSIRFQITNEKSKAVLITKNNPCCQL